MFVKIHAKLEHLSRKHKLFSVAWASMQLFGSRMIGQIAGFAVAAVVANELGPEAFGLYAFMQAMGLLLAGLPGAGLDMATVRLCARDWEQQPDRARGMMVVAGSSKAVCALAMLLLGLALADVVLGQVLQRPDLVLPLRFAALGALALAMTEFMLAALQTQERFGQMFLVNVATTVIKVVPIVVLFYFDALTLWAAMLTFVGAAYASLIFSAFASWHVWRGTAEWNWNTLVELFVFSRWLILNTLLGLLTISVDIVALTLLAGPEETGMYSASRMLALPLSIAANAVGMVLLPKLSRLETRHAVGQYVWFITPPVMAASGIIGAVAFFIAPVVVPLVYGNEYLAAIPVFQMLALAACIQIIVWPFLAGLMVLDRPDTVALLSFVVLAMTTAGYILVTPTFGAVGAAWVLFLSFVVICVPYFLLMARFLMPAPVGVAPNVDT